MAFAGEIEAVHRIRKRNPGIGQRTLARRIVSGSFSNNDDFDDAGIARVATYATNYSRIRRFDFWNGRPEKK